METKILAISELDFAKIIAKAGVIALATAPQAIDEAMEKNEEEFSDFMSVFCGQINKTLFSDKYVIGAKKSRRSVKL